MAEATATPEVKKSLKADRLQKLKQQRERLAQQIAQIEAKEKSKSRKDDTRFKIIVGAAMIAYSTSEPATRNAIIEVLKKTVVAPRDRELLQKMGWL